MGCFALVVCLEWVESYVGCNGLDGWSLSGLVHLPQLIYTTGLLFLCSYVDHHLLQLCPDASSWFRYDYDCCDIWSGVTQFHE